MALSFPPNPVIGQTFLNYTWDGVKWVCGTSGLSDGNCSTPGWFSPIAVSPTAPLDHSIWFNTQTNILSVWASVGVATPQWVQVLANVHTGAVPAAPIAPGTLWIDSLGWLRVFEGMVWREICQPVPGAPVPNVTLPMATSLQTQPSPPTPAPSLWLNPAGPILQWWTTGWITVGTRPMRRVHLMQPPGSIETTGTWGIAARAGDWLHVAGMRGIDPVTNLQLDPTAGGTTPVGDPNYGLNRVRLCFDNMLHVAKSVGCTQWDCVRIIATVTNMALYRPLVNTVQAMPDMWGVGPYPPRRIIGVVQLNGTDTQPEGNSTLPRGDICEIEGYFFRPCCGG